jgi:hypothetical protein
MDSSLAAFEQILWKLCLFKPRQSWEPLPGHYCSKALFRDNGPLKLTLSIEVFLSILEFACHKLRIAHSFTLVTPSLREWEAFRTLGALTYTRITWAPSPMVPQASGVTLVSPLYSWCYGLSSWKGA